MVAIEQVQRAKDEEEIRPLIELCKAGKLFEVRDWIAAGKPVNAPPIPAKGRRCKTPLEIAIALGFHSLVQVLLEGGALIEPIDRVWESPMTKVLQMRRFDLVELLVQQGFDPKAVSMRHVFDTWDPRMMEYFIERGADLQSDLPLAYALCNRIRTALKIFKQYGERFPFLQEQVNIALRYHCKEGNAKWIALMLWAGADPHKSGTDDYSHNYSGDEGISALEYAAIYRHYGIFKMKKINLTPSTPGAVQLLSSLCRDEGLEIAERLLKLGLNPNDQENGGCSAIDDCLQSMSWSFNASSWERTEDGKMDTREARERMKALHLLAKYGGRWAPKDAYEFQQDRRSLSKLDPNYTVEFVWIMSKYKSCSKESLQALLSRPRIKSHISAHRERIRELLSTL